MSQVKAHTTETAKKGEPTHRPEQKPDSGHKQGVARQAAYQHARVNPALLRASEVLALQRSMGNRRLQGVMRQCIGSASDQPSRALVEKKHNRPAELAVINTHAMDHPAPSEKIVQRAVNPTDPRLPATQTDALTYATEAEAAINGAKTRLATSAEPERRNVPDFITNRGLNLQAMTPRHDSTLNAPNINFFFGSINYSDSLVLPQTLAYHITSNRTTVRIRARQEANADNPLSGAEVENRLVHAVREVAYTASAAVGTPASFDLYRAKFNSLWDTAPFATLATAFDPTLDSKGPRTTRARAVFNRIYQEDPALQTAYDQNTGGIRERIDTYIGPEGFNPISSSRLQTLRTVFSSATAPVTGAQYTTFRGNVQVAANALDDSDRQVVEQSNDWQRLINEYVTTQAQRQEIRSIIATAPPSPSAPTPPPTPSSTPPPSTSGPGVTPQQFVNSIRIDGPTAPILANARRQQVTLTPRSAVANPNVAIQSRLTVTPANRVQGTNVSPVSAWPNAATAGVPFQPDIINTSTVNMTAHLDLVNGPTGLVASPPIPDLTFQVQDNRQANFLATWFAGVNFNNGSSQEWFTGSNVVRYRGGTQNFNVVGVLPSGQTNPGLPLSVRASLKRGTSLIAGGPSTLTPFPPDQRQTGRIAMNIAAPATIPTAGDLLTFEVELTDASGAAVLGTKTVSMTVLPEQTYTRAQAIAAATADEAHLHDTSSTGLLGQMIALGGQPARVAAAINPLPPAAPPPGPRITLRALTVRHDSAAFVSQVLGAPNPSKVGYFVGNTYQPLPNTANSFADVAGAAAFQIPSGFGPRFIVANRTTDVFSGAQRSDSSLITLIVHEAVHAMDIRPGAGTDIERYKTEFRAYWMDGRFGPPNQGTCPPLTTPLTGVCPTSGCRDTAFRPELPPPGPKSCRARAIFENHLYGSTTYPFVKPAYDNNTGGFRDAVDNYLIPDGINLMVSVRLEALRALIEGFSGSGFAALRTNVQAFMGVGAAPPLGVLDTDERNAIRNSRAWRNLLDRKITNLANRAQLKTDLGIPQ